MVTSHHASTRYDLRRLMSVQELGKPITVAMPLQLIQDWSFIDKQEGLHQV